MRWNYYDEAVEMLDQRFGFFPHVFRWCGRFYEVDSVEYCWTVVRKRGNTSVERRYFRLRCAAAVFELYQDLVAGTWHVRRVALAPQSVLALPRLAPAWQ